MNELIANIILGAVFVAMIWAANLADYYSETKHMEESDVGTQSEG